MKYFLSKGWLCNYHKEPRAQTKQNQADPNLRYYRIGIKKYLEYDFIIVSISAKKMTFFDVFLEISQILLGLTGLETDTR